MCAKGTDCLPLAFGFIEENALGTGIFTAIGVLWPLDRNSGWIYQETFLQLESNQFRNGNFAVTAQPSLRWMLNLLSNALPMRRLLDTDVENEPESDEECEESGSWRFEVHPVEQGGRGAGRDDVRLGRVGGLVLRA